MVAFTLMVRVAYGAPISNFHHNFQPSPAPAPIESKNFRLENYSSRELQDEICFFAQLPLLLLRDSREFRVLFFFLRVYCENETEFPACVCCTMMRYDEPFFLSE